MKIKLLSTLILMIILTGCWDASDSERMLYIHGFGVDYKDNKYEVYGQIINFSKIAKSDEPVMDPDQSSVGFASGKTIDEAIFNLYKTTDERIYWGHLTFVVLSEELLKNERIDNVIDLLTRFYDTRYQVFVYSTTDDIKDVLLTVPIIKTAVTVSKLANPMNSYEQDSYIEPIDMRKLIIGLNEPNHEMIVPYVSVVKNWETVTDKTDTIHMSGVGVVTPKLFKGFIKDDKANGLKWMNNKTKRGEVSFLLDERDEDSLMVVILTKVNVSVKPIVLDDTVQFDIEVSVDGTLSSVAKNFKKDLLHKRISEEVKREIKETYKEALESDIDIFRLSEYVYRKENKAWKKFEKDGKIHLNENSIRKLHVKVKDIKAGRKSLSRPND